METKQIVEAYFDALASGELERALASFTSDTKWSQPGNNKFSGIKNNLKEIIEMFAGIMKDTAGNMTVRPNGAMMENGNLIAVPVWFSAKNAKGSMDLGGLDLFEVINGKILQVWTFSDNQQVDDDFWG